MTRTLTLFFTTILAGCAAPHPPVSEETLAGMISQRPVVLLGEVHDNVVQHAARAQALSKLLASGARPAIAFEQFDQERQADLDLARIEALQPGVSRVDHLIQRAGGAPSWNWSLYSPYLQLALEYDLPIVAANLSRADAMRVAQQGFGVVFSGQLQETYGLDRLPADFLAKHALAVEQGHCGLMPPDMLPALARAQIARDMTLARSIRPYTERGVILLAGNGHVRNDVGAPYFMTTAERARTTTIGLLESAADGENGASRYDVVIVTPAQPRDDPCTALRKRYSPAAGPPSQ